jgi:hypothetical protein
MRTIISPIKTETFKNSLLPFHHVVWNNFFFFWGGGGGYSMESKNLFYIQKRNIKIMAGTKMTASCKKLFNKFNILPLASKFIMDNIKKMSN